MDKEQISKYRAQSWHLGAGWLDSLCFSRVIYRNTEVVWVSVCWPCTLGRRSSTLSLGSYLNKTLALSASQWRVNCSQLRGRRVGRLSQAGDLWFLKLLGALVGAKWCYLTYLDISLSWRLAGLLSENWMQCKWMTWSVKAFEKFSFTVFLASWDKIFPL